MIKRTLITIVIVCMTMVTMGKINTPQKNNTQQKGVTYILDGEIVQIIYIDENGKKVIIEIKLDKNTDINKILNKTDLV